MEMLPPARPQFVSDLGVIALENQQLWQIWARFFDIANVRDGDSGDLAGDAFIRWSGEEQLVLIAAV